MGKKWGACKRVKGGEVQKVLFLGPKGPHLGGSHLPKSILATGLHQPWPNRNNQPSGYSSFWRVTAAYRFETPPPPPPGMAWWGGSQKQSTIILLEVLITWNNHARDPQKLCQWWSCKLRMLRCAENNPSCPSKSGRTYPACFLFFNRLTPIQACGNSSSCHAIIPDLVLWTYKAKWSASDCKGL